MVRAPAPGGALRADTPHGVTKKIMRGRPVRGGSSIGCYSFGLSFSTIFSRQKPKDADRSWKIHLLSGTGVDNAWDHNCDFSIDIIDAGSGKGIE